MSAEVKALLERFDHLRNSGVCSPTTRGLLDDAQALLAALSSPPADDVREALAHAIQDADDYLHVWQSYLPHAESIMSRFEVRLRGTVTDAEALRLGKVAWVAFQEDKSWAESVVEDCFSPADDLPEEALDMIAVARAVAGAVTGVDALAKAWDAGVRTAGAYGHEDTWTHDMTPYTENPFRGEARS